MSDSRKTKQQLLEELAAARDRAAALEHLAEAEREQRTFAEALAETVATLNSTLDLEEVLKRILEQIGRVMPHDTANILLIDEEPHSLRIAFGPSYVEYGVEISRQGPRVSFPDTPTLRQMAETGHPIVIADTQTDPNWTAFNDDQPSYIVRSYIGAPIYRKGNLIGFINCNSTKPGFYTPAHAEQLKIFANQAAVAIENARLYHLAQQEIDERRKLVDELRAFAYTVAHDIKSPLGIICGLAEVLADEGYAVSGEESRQTLHLINRHAFKLASVVDELLLLSSVRETDRILSDTLDMSALISSMMERLADIIEEEQAEINMPASWPLAMGYGPWIEEVWVNYISNGIKYGGRPPRLELGATPQPDGTIRFWVSDNGNGIPPEDQVGLFTPFTRLDGTKVSGQGLGLSIVRRIIARLGGEVGIQSEPGKGSVFSFTLPGVAET
jgi:signal transduction histidine kinase